MTTSIVTTPKEFHTKLGYNTPLELQLEEENYLSKRLKKIVI